MENWTVVDVLRHARHDWMNRLQLIKGNIALNKIDSVERILEEMILEAQQESRLSNLKLPHFAEILLTFNWNPHPYHMEYEILNESGGLTVDDQWLSTWIQSFFHILDSAVEPYQENYLSITFERFQGKTRFVFDFNGTIKEQKLSILSQWFAAQKEIVEDVKIKEMDISHFSAEFIL